MANKLPKGWSEGTVTNFLGLTKEEEISVERQTERFRVLTLINKHLPDDRETFTWAEVDDLVSAIDAGGGLVCGDEALILRSTRNPHGDPKHIASSSVAGCQKYNESNALPVTDKWFRVCPMVPGHYWVWHCGEIRTAKIEFLDISLFRPRKALVLWLTGANREIRLDKYLDRYPDSFWCGPISPPPIKFSRDIRGELADEH